jgi:ubiquinol-cytochrome c reductase cytochrome b subunit
MAHFDENAKPFSHKWLNERLAIDTLQRVLSTEYWIPKNINFLWAMGMVLAATFGLLLISGIFLLMYYQPNVNTAFEMIYLCTIFVKRLWYVLLNQVISN